jgi:hypothetical protein
MNSPTAEKPTQQLRHTRLNVATRRNTSVGLTADGVSSSGFIAGSDNQTQGGMVC